MNQKPASPSQTSTPSAATEAATVSMGNPGRQRVEQDDQDEEEENQTGGGWDEDDWGDLDVRNPISCILLVEENLCSSLFIKQ